MLEQYRAHEAERSALGIPALPLTASQTTALCELLVNPPKGEDAFVLNLFKERISPGVDPAAEVKASFLTEILDGKKSSPLISRREAIEILGTMMGGYNVAPLIANLEDTEVGPDAIKALSHTTLVYDAFDTVVELSKSSSAAKEVLSSWSNADWFTAKPSLPESTTVKIYKVDDEINTDDFSPAADASTRPDIPLHALAMGKSLFPDGNKTISDWRKEGHKVAFVGDVVGTGSSRKSATNSVLWAIGEDIPAVPNKRREGFVLGGVIAPIFFNTVEDSGGLPIQCDVTNLSTGDEVTIDTKAGTITCNGDVVSTFDLRPNTIADEYQAGGRIALIIGRTLTGKAREALGLDKSTLFAEAEQPFHVEDQGYTLAQKMVAKACDLDGVLPGQSVEPFMTTVGSQDTTGPMTADEITELACLKFQSPLFMQSFCHTSAYPKPADVKTHKTLPSFITSRGGVSLKPGDGVIHTWLNRLLVPDTVGTGGDSHTRFPLGISFPAGSGLVAFAGALGFMPLDMPESVLVKFKGKLRDGITLRDVVNAIPYFAIQKGMLTVPKQNKVNVFNGRILEMEGLPDNITVEQAFELTDAAAERSAAAATIKLSEASVVKYLKSNVALMEKMIEQGYGDASTIQNRIDAVNEWLKNPVLMERDDHAEFAEVLEIDLNDITEPILCCPNDPDDVKMLGEVAGIKVKDVFIGSCMTNIGHFRAASKIWEGAKVNPNTRTYVAPPTRMDQAKLKEEAHFSVFNQIGASIEGPGCSLCMGNQLRVADGDVVYSTSTRNFNNRMGDGAQVYLGSAELGAIVAMTSELPTPEEYFAVMKNKIENHEDEVYEYLQFDEEESDGLYGRRDI